MSDQTPTNAPELTKLTSALIFIGSFLFNGNQLSEIADDTLDELRDLIDLELVLRRGTLH